MLGAALVTAVALIVAVVKLLMGTVVKVDKALRDYCGVIQRGVNAYQGTDGGPAVAVGVPVAAAMAREQIPIQVPLGVGPGTTLSIEHRAATTLSHCHCHHTFAPSPHRDTTRNAWTLAHLDTTRRALSTRSIEHES